jgi:arabinose-5-phosphate isomerase
VVECVLECQGKIVITGIGKAGAVGRKLAATFSSTGTPALFLHPSEGVHGDLGVVAAPDIVIALSQSGESDEILRLLPTLRAIGATLIAMTGASGSSLASSASLILDTSIEREACPLGLAPTASSIAMMALGDALAMAVMDARGFSKEAFAVYHPAGALGKRLTQRVADVMRTGNRIATVSPDTTILEAMFRIGEAGAGAALVLTEDGVLVGLLTDGDIRRLIVSDRSSLDSIVELHMNARPVVICGNPLLAEALESLEYPNRKPGELPVVDADGRPVGVLNLKDLMQIGEA